MRTATLLLLVAVIAICPVLISCDSPEAAQPVAPTPEEAQPTAPTPEPVHNKPVKPAVGPIPEGWNLTAQDPYGTYRANDGTRWGLVEYTNKANWDFVQIFYGDIPPELKGNEGDRNTLINKAVDYFAPIRPANSDTITIGDRLAGYARAYDEEHDWYDMEIVFVSDSTCIDICTRYGATYVEDEKEVMSLIYSIQ